MDISTQLYHKDLFPTSPLISEMSFVLDKNLLFVVFSKNLLRQSCALLRVEF